MNSWWIFKKDFWGYLISPFFYDTPDFAESETTGEKKAGLSKTVFWLLIGGVLSFFVFRKSNKKKR